MNKIIFITLLVFISAFNFGLTAPLENVAKTTFSTTVGPTSNMPQSLSTFSPLIADGGSNPTSSDAGNVPSEETIPNGEKHPSNSTMNPTETSDNTVSEENPATPSPLNHATSTTLLSISAIILPIITFCIFKN